MEKELPIGWVETSLLNIVEVCTGKKDANYATSDGKYLFFTCAYEPLRSDDYSFEGEVLILPGNGVNVGEVFYYAGKFEAYQRTYIVSNIKINPKYLFYHFKRYWKEIGTAQQYGSATNYIKIGNFNDYRINFPPLPEQQRIVTKLDTLFGQIDKIKTHLERIPQLLKDFRQKVLTQAVTGKLTEEWREGKELEPIEFITIKRFLLRSKPSKSNQEKIETIFDEREIGLFSIPDKWIFANLNKVCNSFSYGTSEKSDNDGLIPVLRMGNLQNGKIDWSDLKYSSNKEEIEKYKLKAGDVLFNRTNSPELVGKTSIYRDEMPAIYAGYLIKIEVIESFLDPKYLNISLNTEFAKNWCWSVKSDGVSQSNINAQKLARFVISLPSIEEQQEIVHRVESLFAKADKIEASYQKLKEKIEQLPQAILAKAFRGELVEQLPTDGDALELLEEIKKLKGEGIGAGKGKKLKPEEKMRMVAEAGVKYGKK